MYISNNIPYLFVKRNWVSTGIPKRFLFKTCVQTQICVQFKLLNFYIRTIIFYLKFIRVNYEISLFHKEENINNEKVDVHCWCHMPFAADSMARNLTCILTCILVFYLHVYFPIGNQRRKMENQNKKECLSSTVSMR